jgi:ComF family protein
MLAEGVVETIWTTRCIICDRPGNVLCACCRIQLPYIDRWLACPRCGSPHGGLQCVDCNTFSLSEVGRDNLPFERCVCAIEHRGMARAIITGYKDAGERRLSADIARIIADTLPRTWISPDSMLTFIPADRMARRRRGFDHMAAIAAELSRITQMPCTPLLQKACASDQRGLSRYERFQNMAGAIRMKPEASIQEGRRIILVDDVYTTGATLFAACDALRQAGARTVYCATFARVP